jgi:hypothetical protein
MRRCTSWLHAQVWAEGKSFTSFRKVALDEKIEGAVVFSLHSISKGFLGECGHRRAFAASACSVARALLSSHCTRSARAFLVSASAGACSADGLHVSGLPGHVRPQACSGSHELPREVSRSQPAMCFMRFASYAPCAALVAQGIEHLAPASAERQAQARRRLHGRTEAKAQQHCDCASHDQHCSSVQGELHREPEQAGADHYAATEADVQSCKFIALHAGRTRRGGYMECLKVPEPIIVQLKKLMSISLCANTVGQIMVATMMSPPQEGARPTAALCTPAQAAP